MTGICVSLTEPTTEATLARMASLADVADLFEPQWGCQGGQTGVGGRPGPRTRDGFTTATIGKVAK